MRRLPTVTPRQYERVALAALVLVFGIILTGAAVRLTGSGLGCTNWPKCGSSVVAPLEFNAWVEFGNRLITGLVGLPCLATFVLAYRRRPYRRDLRRLSMLLPLGVLGQAVLGGFTVIYELKPGFVMAHFLLSQAILAVAVALWWRARHEPETRPKNDRRTVIATRLLLPLGALVALRRARSPRRPARTPGSARHRGDRAALQRLRGRHARRRCTTGTGARGRCSAWPPSPSGCSPGAAGATSGARRVADRAVPARRRPGGRRARCSRQLQLPAGLVWVHVALATSDVARALSGRRHRGSADAGERRRAGRRRSPHFWGGAGPSIRPERVQEPV